MSLKSRFYKWLRRVVDRYLDGTFEKLPEKPTLPKESPQPPASTPAPPDAPNAQWRTDAARIPAKDGVIEFETRNVKTPTQSKPNGENEWIIATIRGRGFERLIISTMSPSPDNRSRNPARIMFMYGQPEGQRWFWDGLFSMPRPGPDKWRVDTQEGRLRIFLNGSSIWESHVGQFEISHAQMMENESRKMLGEWRIV